MIPILESTSFLNRASTLPPPSEIRSINSNSGDIRSTNFHRPLPVKIPSLGLVVKYGADTTTAEAETQKMVYDRLRGKVPVPEVYGGGQGFIYMELIDGDTLEERWCEMSEIERVDVCSELHGMVKMWRSIEYDGDGIYIGSINNQPLNELFLYRHPTLQGPYYGADAVQRFQQGCEIDIEGEIPVVFTHNDLLPPNTLLTRGPNPRVAAVIDWAQAGWYPAYWEYCKVRRIRTNPDYFSDEVQEEWNTKYLPRILDPVDEETFYHPFVWFYLSMGV